MTFGRILRREYPNIPLRHPTLRESAERNPRGHLLFGYDKVVAAECAGIEGFDEWDIICSSGFLPC